MTKDDYPQMDPFSRLVCDRVKLAFRQRFSRDMVSLKFTDVTGRERLVDEIAVQIEAEFFTTLMRTEISEGDTETNTVTEGVTRPISWWEHALALLRLRSFTTGTSTTTVHTRRPVTVKTVAPVALDYHAIRGHEREKQVIFPIAGSLRSWWDR